MFMGLRMATSEERLALTPHSISDALSPKRS